MTSMMLMFVLCFVIQAHSFRRSQTPPTPAPSDQGKASVEVKPEGPVHEQQVENLVMSIFGYNVSVIQNLYSLTHSHDSYRNKPVFKKWDEARPPSTFAYEKFFYERVDEVFMTLARSFWTTSTTKEVLVGEWLMLNEDARVYFKKRHPGFFIIEKMVPEELRNRWEHSC
ncbi:hypothetical protein GCK32_016740 [Trichostrongylus colubriformis]|uniref:Uncharacterized protein n=1 Tax=Trichostrongylus colubriformis TaxID=6319 RepID=A0AAN8F5T6_TRICO